MHAAWRNAVCPTCAPLLLLLISLMHASPRLVAVETGTTTGWRVAAAIFVFIIYRWSVALPTQVANICANPVVGMCLLNSELDGPADISDSRLAWKSPLSHHLLVSVSAHVPLVKIHGHRVKCYIFVVRTSADFDRGSRIFFKILRNGRKVLMNERTFRF